MHDFALFLCGSGLVAAGGCFISTFFFAAGFFAAGFFAAGFYEIDLLYARVLSFGASEFVVPYFFAEGFDLYDLFCESFCLACAEIAAGTVYSRILDNLSYFLPFPLVKDSYHVTSLSTRSGNPDTDYYADVKTSSGTVLPYSGFERQLSGEDSGLASSV